MYKGDQIQNDIAFDSVNRKLYWLTPDYVLSLDITDTNAKPQVIHSALQDINLLTIDNKQGLVFSLKSSIV